VLTVCEDSDEERFLAALMELSAACAERDLGCVLEFMRFSECGSFEQAVRIVQRASGAGASRVGVLVDALHLQRSGGTTEQVATYATQLPELFPYVQLCDGPIRPPRGGIAQFREEAVTSRLLPGDGELPLRALLSALPPGIPVSVETPVRVTAMLDDTTRAAAAFEASRNLLLGASTSAQ
jgi:sugar phosphate isomerase/epimerase